MFEPVSSHQEFALFFGRLRAGVQRHLKLYGSKPATIPQLLEMVIVIEEVQGIKPKKVHLNAALSFGDPEEKLEWSDPGVVTASKA